MKRLNLKHSSMMTTGIAAAVLMSPGAVAPAAAQGAMTKGPMKATLSGIVTSVEGERGFVLHTQNGYEYPVRMRWGQKLNLYAGDRVRVFGEWRDYALHAGNVRLLLQGGMTREQHRGIITGTVINDVAGDQFTFRAPNGYSYTARAVSGKPDTLSAGDRVRLFGQWSGGLLRAENVRVVREGNESDVRRMNEAATSSSVMRGVVTNDLEGDRFVMRLANGYTYRVVALYGEPDSLRVGSTLRVYGQWREGMLQARTIRVLD